MAIGRLQTEADLDRFIAERVNGLLAQFGALNRLILTGTGSPEGAVAAPPPSIFLRRDGGAGTVLYVKEGGDSGPTGWVAK